MDSATMIVDDGSIERLDGDERRDLAEQLAAIGPWTYLAGTRGVHRAERVGTERYEQASATADGLLAAVHDCERRLTSA
jgi:hypothetical protein